MSSDGSPKRRAVQPSFQQQTRHSTQHNEPPARPSPQGSQPSAHLADGRSFHQASLAAPPQPGVVVDARSSRPSAARKRPCGTLEATGTTGRQTPTAGPSSGARSRAASVRYGSRKSAGAGGEGAAGRASSEDSSDGVSVGRGTQGARYEPQRIMRIGMTTVLFLEAKDVGFHRKETKEFLQILADRHNEQVPPQSGKMCQDRFDRRSEVWDYSLWHMRPEARAKCWPSKHRVALISPTYDVSPCSTWRNKVNATWRFLDENYIISKSEVGATNLHVSYLPNLDDGGRMRTAWCALYFEAAIGSLAPGPAGRESFVKLNSQSCYLSTIPSDKILQTIKTRVENGGSIGRIMNDKDGASESKMYRWNFRLNGSLEFRLPHGCVSAVEVLGWAEFVLIFVRAAYTIKKPEDLDVYSARRMDELMLFLRDRGGLVSDVTDSTRLKQFFRDKGYDYTRPPHLQ